MLRIVAVENGPLLQDRLLDALEDRHLGVHRFRGELRRRLVRILVEMHRESIRQAAACALVKKFPRPADVVVIRTARDQEESPAIEIAQVARELAILIGVMLRRHLPAAAPVFVADAPVPNAKRLRRTVRRALVGERTAGRVIAILHPIAHLLRRSASYVSGQIRLRPDLSAQPDELMDAEAVVFDVLAPMYVDALGALRADAVAPV